jgi:hypothetical protein
MYSAAAHIRQRRHSVLAHIVLNVEVPLLHVGPGRFARNRDKRQRSSAGAEECGSQIGIARDVYDATGLGVDVVGLERLGIGFIAVGVLEEDAVASAYGPLPVTEADQTQNRYGARDSTSGSPCNPWVRRA